MDDLNLASAEPAAAMPPESTAGGAESSVAQTPPVELALLPGAEQAAAQPEGQPETPTSAAVEPTAPVPVAGPPADEVVAAVDQPQPVKAVETAKEKPEKKAEEKAKGKPQEEAEEEPQPKSDKMDWYILKVQSNREESIREGLLRRVNIAGLGFFFDQVIVPTEKVTEFKGGKKKVIKRKLYPGYLVVHMEINDDTWFLVRETPGIGDFTGAAGRPSPMLPHEVVRIVAKQEEKSEKAPKLKIAFREGERVKIKEGTFENFEGEVESIDETNGRVTVMINIFGRSTPVELEYWQIETL
jgi:transcription termination/antitermination protein NusG